MYSSREKLRIFNEIPNVNAAGADLVLLQRMAPQHSKLNVFKMNPKRYAGDILFALLDVCTREEIITNRRESDKEAEVPVTVEKDVATSDPIVIPYAQVVVEDVTKPEDTTTEASTEEVSKDEVPTSVEEAKKKPPLKQTKATPAGSSKKTRSTKK